MHMWDIELQPAISFYIHYCVYNFKVKLNTNKTSLTTCHESNSVNKYFIDVCFPGKARVKLENKGDLSFFAKQDEAVSIRQFLS